MGAATMYTTALPQRTFLPFSHFVKENAMERLQCTPLHCHREHLYLFQILSKTIEGGYRTLLTMVYVDYTIHKEIIASLKYKRPPQHELRPLSHGTDNLGEEGSF